MLLWLPKFILSVHPVQENEEKDADSAMGVHPPTVDSATSAQTRA